jgi:hypothetical protein
MKLLITENQSETAMLRLLKRFNIEPVFLYWQDDGMNSITGTVYLYKNDEILGYRLGYGFEYYYDWTSNSLKFVSNNQRIEKVDVFASLPPDFVIKYFSDKMKTYLENQINKGYTGIRVSN